MFGNETAVDVQMRRAAIQKDLGRYASDGAVEFDETMIDGLGDLIQLMIRREHELYQRWVERGHHARIVGWVGWIGRLKAL